MKKKKHGKPFRISSLLHCGFQVSTDTRSCLYHSVSTFNVPLRHFMKRRNLKSFQRYCYTPYSLLQGLITLKTRYNFLVYTNFKNEKNGELLYYERHSPFKTQVLAFRSQNHCRPASSRPLGADQ